ncbi:GNAT family N-acetyltransferase [Kribbella turkmenica]|uniref:GNAT family N-acetyltransferase n=1 Tax=Kribbella turkmenica TaxID=2530375 RepID=A0A4R4WG64_9ACTN|nr:GNAT family N-acetyltransferase [Kribbella turkmenica]TDD14465.1 GNAT family N-acetyltransferase [Kribbella turkmenica]
MGSVEFRSAGIEDAEQVAWLHADSWRRHYRGAYSDSFLDGDIDADRREVWSKRLAGQSGTATVLAEYDGRRLAGFVHVMFDHDPQWGSLVDNLHVDYRHHRGGIGTRLMARAARAVSEQARGNAMYLWVLEQNTRARDFYRAAGGDCVETSTVPPPGGDPTRLNGTPICLRITWPDVTLFGQA